MNFVFGALYLSLMDIFNDGLKGLVPKAKKKKKGGSG